MNKLRILVGLLVLILPAYAGMVVYFGFSPLATDVGYAPTQPIPFSHALHAGELGMDCRYCHTTVEKADHAAVPPTLTCINCHSQQYGIRKSSPKLAVLQEAFYGSERNPPGLPIPWIRVHDLPDYAYFSHAAHVNRGVGCVECHGRIDRMETVYQSQPLSMGWCLECHRDPAPRLRPLTEITNMSWRPPADEDPVKYGQKLLKEYNIRDINYLQSCSVCHH